MAQAYQPKPRIRGKVPEREAPSQINPLSTLFYLATLYTNVLVKTALARIKSASGLEKTARVMFDDGSDKTWIGKGLADELRLDGTKEAVAVTTFGWSVGKLVTSHKVEFSLAHKEGNNSVKVKALAFDDVGAPVNAVRVTPSAWPHPDQIKFADSYPREMQFLDVLIGQDFELEFATSEPKILGPKGTPGTVKTTLGWILCGPLNEVQRRKQEP